MERILEYFIYLLYNMNSLNFNLPSTSSTATTSSNYNLPINLVQLAPRNRQYMLIDSKNRVSGTSTDFYYQFSTPVKLTNFIKLVYANIPNSEYLIKTGINDTFYINYNGGGEASITLTAGAFNSQNLTTLLQNAILTLYPSSGFSVSFDITTFKFTFSATNNFYFRFGTQTGNNLMNILGFANSQTSTANSITSDNAIYIISTPYVNIYIDQLSSNSNVITDKNIKSTFFVPITSERSIVDSYSELSMYENIIYFSSSLSFSGTQITLYDQYQNVFQNNGLPVNLLMIYE